MRYAGFAGTLCGIGVSMVGHCDVAVSAHSHVPIPPPPQRAKRAIEVEGFCLRFPDPLAL